MTVTNYANCIVVSLHITREQSKDKNGIKQWAQEQRPKKKLP